MCLLPASKGGYFAGQLGPLLTSRPAPLSPPSSARFAIGACYALGMSTDRTYTIAVLVGSLRPEGFSKTVARTLISLAPSSLEFEFVEIGDLALYNMELEEAVPPAWAEFRSKVRSKDALLFVTPEYNRSIPGALKNAIDVGSRPYGHSVWSEKPAGVVSVSPGNMGAFGANHHLRQTFVFLNVPVMQQPEAYIGGVVKLFDSEGNLVDEGTREFFRTYMNAFETWIKSMVRV